jgi:hypothetical protein
MRLCSLLLGRRCLCIPQLPVQQHRSSINAVSMRVCSLVTLGAPHSSCPNTMQKQASLAVCWCVRRDRSGRLTPDEVTQALQQAGASNK